MTAIETELDRLIDAHEHKLKLAVARRRLSRGVFEAHRKKVNPTAHPLRKRRVSFRDGLTVEELAARALVAERTIRAIEKNEPGSGSDLTFRRLALALDCTRAAIDPSWLKP